MLLTLPNAYGDAATNMAIDASLLDSTPAGVAVLRHYGWSEPAITFGYTQRVEDVRNTVDTDLTLCRRITGGGIVDHRNDWTYTTGHQRRSAHRQRACDRPLSQAAQGHSSHAPEAGGRQPTGALPESLPHPAFRIPLPAPRTPHPAHGRPMLCSSGRQRRAQRNWREDRRSGHEADPSGPAHSRLHRPRSLAEDFDFNSFGQALPAQLAHALGLEIGHSNDLRALFDGPRIQQERERFQSAVWLKKR